MQLHPFLSGVFDFRAVITVIFGCHRLKTGFWNIEQFLRCEYSFALSLLTEFPESGSYMYFSASLFEIK